MEPININGTRLILLTQWNKYHSYPTLGGLRVLRFNGDKNEFNKKVVKRIGTRILLDEKAYFEWVEENNN